MRQVVVVDALKSHVDKLCHGPRLLHRLQEEASYCSWLLKRCGEVRELTAGKRIHSYLCRSLGLLTFDSNLLIRMYGRCGKVAEAQIVFDSLQQPNVFSRTILLSAYAQNGHVVGAGRVFGEMACRDSVAWNAMISVYADSSQEDRALRLFWLMTLDGVRWTETTLLTVVSILATRRYLGLEQVLEETSSTWSVSVSNAMITLHSKRGSLSESCRIFERMTTRDGITWNALIAACIHNGSCEQALDTFRRMNAEGVRVGSVTVLMLLEACSKLEDGELLHVLFISSGDLGVDHQRGLLLGTALISMYGRCGSPAAAERVFEELEEHDVVSWSAMITAYVRNDMHEAALKLFRLTEVQGTVKPNRITLSAALAACAGVQDIHLGDCLVGELDNWNSSDSVDISGAVIDMYSKCGRIEKAQAAFNRNRKNPVCWNAMVSGLALNGYDDEAVNISREMEVEGVGTDKATFVTLLSMWSHSGRLSDAARCFQRLENDHGVRPSMEHYGCMVDLLGRMGMVEQAELMVEVVPWYDQNAAGVVWLTLLGACSTHRDVHRGTRVASTAKGASDKAALYHLLFNIHACGED